MCGTISPMNPIAPVADTKTEVSNDATITIKVFIKLTFIPSIVAFSSPKSNKSNDLDNPKTTKTTKTRITNGIGSNSQVAPPKLPIVQNNALFTWLAFFAKEIIKSVSAVKIVDIANPERISLVVEVFLPYSVPITKTSTLHINVPMKAPVDTDASPIAPPPKTMTNTAPVDAPDAKPSTYGSAIGFLVTHCISTPQTASPAPQIIDNKTLGSLTSQIIVSCVSGQYGS